MKNGTRIKVSSGDEDGTHPYLLPNRYLQIASYRLQMDRGLLGPNYRKLLEKQVLECHQEIEKKAK